MDRLELSGGRVVEYVVAGPAADVATDVAALLDAIGAEDFVTLGWSGGGIIAELARA